MGARVDDVSSASRAVDRGLVSFALAWQLLWFIADPSVWPSAQVSSLTATGVAAAIVAGAVLLVAHLGGRARLDAWARWADMSALFVATVGLLAATAATAEQEWSGPCSWALLPAGLAGLLFGWRVAVTWLGALLLTECAFVFGLVGTAVDDPTARDILYPLYTLSVGVITIAARYALLIQAGHATDAASQAVAATHARMAAEGLSVDVHREERVLHETVLNTLIAIVRVGGDTPLRLRDAMRSRCAESARVLRALQSHAVLMLPESATVGRLELDVRAAVDELRGAGVTVHVECEPLPVPHRVYDALVSATREALSNSARHALPQAVSLVARVVTSPNEVAVRVEVRDDGVGFDPQLPSDRYGLSKAISRPMAEVGGTAVIDTSPGAGTIVTLEWKEASHDDDPSDVASPAAFAIPVLLSLGAFAAAQLLVGWSEYASHAADLLAFALFVGLALLLGWAGLRGPYQWWILIVVAAVSPAIYQLQVHALSDSAVDTWVEWSSGAIAALFLVLAAGGPGWGWLVLLGTWLFIQGDVLTEIRAPGTALILAAALYGRTSRSNADRIRRDRSAGSSQRIAELEARNDVGRIQRRYGALHESSAADLLDAISDGRRDPQDDSVKAEAALEERFIRTVVHVDPSLDAVHALATSLAVTARRARVILDVDIASGVRVEDLTAARRSLTTALECSQPAGVARFTARREGAHSVVRLVAPIWPSSREVMRELPVRGVDLDPNDPADPDMLWEIRSASEEGT